MSIVSIIVCLSNLAALPAIFAAPEILDKIVVTAAMIASMLMHISERKHKLPGVLFRDWSWQFLQLDRAISVAASLYLGWTMYNLIFEMGCVPAGISAAIVIFANGVLWLWFSEHDVSQLLFCIWHTLWHLNAFYLAYFILWQKNTCLFG